MPNKTKSKAAVEEEDESWLKKLTRPVATIGVGAPLLLMFGPPFLLPVFLGCVALGTIMSPSKEEKAENDRLATGLAQLFLPSPKRILGIGAVAAAATVLGPIAPAAMASAPFIGPVVTSLVAHPILTTIAGYMTCNTAYNAITTIPKIPGMINSAAHNVKDTITNHPRISLALGLSVLGGFSPIARVGAAFFGLIAVKAAYDQVRGGGEEVATGGAAPPETPKPLTAATNVVAESMLNESHVTKHSKRKNHSNKQHKRGRV